MSSINLVISEEDNKLKSVLSLILHNSFLSWSISICIGISNFPIYSIRESTNRTDANSVELYIHT